MEPIETKWGPIFPEIIDSFFVYDVKPNWVCFSCMSGTDGYHLVELPDGQFQVFFGSYEYGWFYGYAPQPTASLAVFFSDWPLPERREKGHLTWL